MHAYNVACTTSSVLLVRQQTIWYACTFPILTTVRCPAGSRFLRSPQQNFVHPSPDQLNVLQTGFIPAFLLGVGNTVHVHCTVKICLVGNEADCALVSNIS